MKKHSKAAHPESERSWKELCLWRLSRLDTLHLARFVFIYVLWRSKSRGRRVMATVIMYGWEGLMHWRLG